MERKTIVELHHFRYPTVEQLRHRDISSNNNLLSVPFELIYDDTLLPIHEINYEQKGKDKFIEQFKGGSTTSLPRLSFLGRERAMGTKLV